MRPDVWDGAERQRRAFYGVDFDVLSSGEFRAEFVFFPFEDCGGKVGDVTREGNYVVRERYTYF